jgi:hypothetical protein
MQFCRLRSAVGCSDSHQDVVRAVLGIFHENVEIPVLVEDTGVEQFILRVVPGTMPVRLH